MAGPTIQFDDPILPVGQVQRVASANKNSGVYEKRSTDLNDEEKARQIANADLHGSRKQVNLVLSLIVYPKLNILADIQWLRSPLAELSVDRHHLR